MCWILRVGIWLLVVLVSGCAAGTRTAVEPAVGLRQTQVPAVPAAVPTSLAIPALDLTARIRPMDAGDCPVLNPPTVDDAYWVGCRAMPGTDSDGTVIIIGHAVAHGQGVFNELPKLAIGESVQVATANGDLTYRVTRTATYGKHGEIQAAPEMRARVPGRLVLVTCYVIDGQSTEENYVVETKLVAAQRR